MNIIVPMRLKRTCPIAACLAGLEAPIDATMAVSVVPMLSPSIMGMAASRVIRPCEATAIVRPIVAAEDCIKAVRIIPARTPVRGLRLRIRRSSLCCAITWEADFMVCIPRKTIPSPMRPLAR